MGSSGSSAYSCEQELFGAKFSLPSCSPMPGLLTSKVWLAHLDSQRSRTICRLQHIGSSLLVGMSHCVGRYYIWLPLLLESLSCVWDSILQSLALLKMPR